MQEIERWLKVKDVAKILSMTNRTVHKLIYAGTIPAKRIGHHWRVPESGLKEYLENQD